MKKFNVLIVAVWLAIFGLATVPTSNVANPPDWHDLLISEINTKFADMTWASPTNEKGEPLALNESSATQFYLNYTFTTVLFFLAALNIAFYAGKGKFGKWGKIIAKRWQNALSPIRTGLALRRRQKQDTRLRSDQPFEESFPEG
jgi:hypothetical protein